MDKPKERILLVENDPELSDLISRQTLKPLGYQVAVVGAAATAIQEAVNYAPDVILADLNLSGLSGKDLLVALNAQGLDIPVIVIAPKGMESDVIQAFRLGASDLLYCPIREAEVVAVIERVLRQVRTRRDRELLAHQLHQTNQELQRRVRELTTIFAIGKAVITTTDQQDLFNKILEGATFVSEADSGWLLVREQRGKTYILRAARNVPKDVVSRVNQPWDDGLSSLVALSGEPLAIHGEPLKRFKVAQFGSAAMVVPVRVKKEVMGLLTVMRKTTNPFNANQQALLEAVADYASISLVNATLFKALEERVNLLQSMANTAVVDKQIEEEVLEKTAKELHASLQAIKKNIDLLMSKEIGRLNHEQGIATGMIQEKLKAALEIIEFMQSKSGSASKQKNNRTNLTEMIQQTIQRMQPVAHRAGISLKAELPSTAFIVLADPGQIAKALEGLLTNAIKYSLQGGVVKIQADNPNETTVRVAVHDDGVGIDPKRLPFIFKPGLTEPAPSAGRFGGVGISLPLIHDIIGSNGGKLWVESQPGKGSTFYFTLSTSS